MKTLDTKEFRVVLAITLLLLIVFALHWCNSNPQPINEPIENTNTLNELVKDKEAIIVATMENNKVLRDSLFMLLNRKPKYIKGRDRVKDSLIYVADTACINSLVTLYNQCAKVDSVNEFIISNQSSQIGNLITVTNNQQDIIDIKKYQHGVDSINEIAYKERIIADIKTAKRKYRKGLLQGGVVGLGVGFIGGLIVK